MMNKSEQIRLLLQCVFLMKKCALFPKTNSINYYRQLVLHAHNRGWLYCGFENGRIDMCAIAFRVKEFDESILKKLPEEEEGNTLFVLTLASKSRDHLKALRLLRYYLKTNPDVDKVQFYKRYDSNGLRTYHIKEKAYAR